MIHKLKPGDVVRHKKTGILAIVQEKVLSYGWYRCRTMSWGSGSFEASELEPTGATFDLQQALEDAVEKSEGANP